MLRRLSLMPGLPFALGVLLISLGVLSGAASAASKACPNEALREGQHSTYLPDCRAYEMVSTPEKGGGNVIRSSARTQSAVSGEGLKFSSLSAFGDVQGTAVATEYISRRSPVIGTQGWATHSITPQLDPFSTKFAANMGDAGYMALSSELSSGVFKGYTNLTKDPNVEQVQNFYLRDNLLEGGAGSYQLMSACAICVSPLTKDKIFTQPEFADASPGLDYVLFDATANLVEGATGEEYKLYEWAHGKLGIAGVFPASEGGEVALGAMAGQGTRFDSLNTLSDGSDGHSRVFFTAGGERALYMRLDGATTVRASASERTDCAEHNPCGGTPEPDPNGIQPAIYEIAATDGERVFFLSEEALTDNAPLNAQHLYMYDASKPDSDPHNLTLIASAGRIEGVMGAGADGKYVYFMSEEQSVPGAPSLNGEIGFFMWHDGALSFIGASSENGNVSIIDSVRHADGANNAYEGPRVTPDGKALLFLALSGDELTGYDHGQCSGQPCMEVYLYNAQAEKVVCVSCNPSGTPASADASFVSNEEIGGSFSLEGYRSHSISDDGRYVFFQTAERLVSEDVNGKQDVYEYDAVTGQVHLISSGTSDSDSSFLDASPDGRNAFFATAQPLVGWDADANYDVYDARIGGGFPEPAVAALACEGDTCRALSAPPVASLTVGSAADGGAGNVRAVPVARAKPKFKPVKCGRGFVRRKVRGRARCVKRRGRTAVKSKSASGRGK